MPKRDHGVLANSWWDATIPTVGPTGTTTTRVGVRFRVTVPGRINGFRFYDSFGIGAANQTIFQLMDWATTRLIYVAESFQAPSANTAAQWNQKWFRPWFRPVVGHDYLLTALYIGGGFFRTNSSLTTPVTHNNITFVSSFQSTALDMSSASLTELTNANAVDILFQGD